MKVGIGPIGRIRTDRSYGTIWWFGRERYGPALTQLSGTEDNVPATDRVRHLEATSARFVQRRRFLADPDSSAVPQNEPSPGPDGPEPQEQAAAPQWEASMGEKVRSTPLAGASGGKILPPPPVLEGVEGENQRSFAPEERWMAEIMKRIDPGDGTFLPKEPSFLP